MNSFAVIPHRFLFLTGMSMLSGCASTGDWRDDSIFFDPHLADQHLQPKLEQVGELNRQTTAEEIHAARVRRDIGATRAVAAANRSEERRLRARTSSAPADLAAVERELASAELDASEAERLRSQRDALQREVNRLDTLLADLLEVKRQRYPR